MASEYGALKISSNNGSSSVWRTGSMNLKGVLAGWHLGLDDCGSRAGKGQGARIVIRNLYLE